MIRNVLILTAAVVLVAQVALADGASFEARVRACVEESDDTQRLACYDREAGTLAEAGDTGDTGIPAVQETNADTVDRQAGPDDDVDQFGMNPKLARSNPDIEQDTGLREILATAVKVSERAHGELVVTLDNGQVWTEKSPTFGFKVKAGDAIRIEKGSFSGAYRMYGSRRSSQVRRVK